MSGAGKVSPARRAALLQLQQWAEAAPKRRSKRHKFGFDRKHPFSDFNKEICAPGTAPALPDGAVGIRADDDFWTVALLPYEFHTMSIRDIVSVLWPKIAAPEFGRTVRTKAARQAKEDING